MINGRRQLSPHWFLSRDGDPDALEIMKRHYSWHEYKDGRPHKLFVGPGVKLEADQIASEKWPGERLFTYVNARRVKSQNPGYCFLKAGWTKCGITKWNKLVILEKLTGMTPSHLRQGDR